MVRCRGFGHAGWRGEGGGEKVIQRLGLRVYIYIWEGWGNGNIDITISQSRFESCPTFSQLPLFCMNRTFPFIKQQDIKKPLG